MSDSESPLSSAPDTEDEIIPPSLAKGRTFKPPSVVYSSPAGKKQRKKEPPHIPTFADIPEIAVSLQLSARLVVTRETNVLEGSSLLPSRAASTMHSKGYPVSAPRILKQG